MIRALSFAALIVLTASPAFAAGATCSTAPSSSFKPKSDLEAMLKKDAISVRKIKIEKGCYEVYGIGKDGKKVNQAYNAETLEKVDNPEAGEN